MKLLLTVKKMSGLIDNFDASHQAQCGFCDNQMQAILRDLGPLQINAPTPVPR